MKPLRYLILTALLLAALLDLGISSRMEGGTLGQVGCTVTVQLGESIQAAIDAAEEGDVICLEEGTWEENLKIEKPLTLRGVGQEQTIIKGKEEGYPVVWIASPEGPVQTVSIKVEGLSVTGARGQCANYAQRVCPNGFLIRGSVGVELANVTITDNTYGIVLEDLTWIRIDGSIISNNLLEGVYLSDSSRAVITDSSIRLNGRRGIWLDDEARAEISHTSISNNKLRCILLNNSAQAEIVNSIIYHNVYGILLTGRTKVKIIDSTVASTQAKDGVHLSGSAQAIIERSKIPSNQRYGVALYQSPCDDVGRFFHGHIAGRANTIPGPGEPYGNGEGAVCPEELDFLMTEEGGEYP